VGVDLWILFAQARQKSSQCSLQALDQLAISESRCLALHSFCLFDAL